MEVRTTNEELESVSRMARESSTFLGELATKLNSKLIALPDHPPIGGGPAVNGSASKQSAAKSDVGSTA